MHVEQESEKDPNSTP